MQYWLDKGFISLDKDPSVQLVKSKTKHQTCSWNETGPLTSTRYKGALIQQKLMGKRQLVYPFH